MFSVIGLALGMALSHTTITTTKEGYLEWRTRDFSLNKVRNAPANDSTIRTYVLNAVVDNPPIANCDVAFEKINKLIFWDLPADAVDYDGVFGCLADDDDAVTRVSLRFALEARTEADVVAFTMYLASHQGQDLWGTELDFRRVFAVLADTSLRFLDRTGEDPDNEGREIFRISKHQLFVNMKEQRSWIYSSTDLVMDGEIESVIAWISSEFGSYYGTTARDRWLREANAVELRSNPQYLVEDRTIAYPDSVFDGGDRDCSETTNGRCI